MKKVAVSSQGQSLDDLLDPRFGRCNYFIIAEVDNGKILNDKYISNSGGMGRGGAGISAAQLMGNEKVEIVITGNVGPNAYSVLSNLNIEIYSGNGKVKDAINDYIQGKLKKI